VLTQPIITLTSTSASGATLTAFAASRTGCRYFVPTAELFSAGLEHAATWWLARGSWLRLEDEAAALARAEASDGVHFSFEKRDFVTCSTVCSTLPISEEMLYRGELISFAVPSLALAAARDYVSNLEQQEEASNSAQAEERVTAEAQAAEDAAAESAALAAASSARYAEISVRRDSGKHREAERKRMRTG